MKAFLFALLMTVGVYAQAQDMGVIVGARADSADATTAGLTTQGKTNFQVGAIAKFELKDAWQIRSGFIYTQRNYTLQLGSNDIGDLKFTYFEIPVGLLYKFSDFGGAFVGTSLDFNVSKSCPGGSCTGVSSMPIGMQVGASFKFAPQMGAEIYYEALTSKLADNAEAPKAVIVNFMVTFD